MATGIWEALQMPTAARIVLTSNGHAEVSCATSDIGTGTYTIMAQVAADMLGLPIDNITVKLGDSTLPRAEVEGGSWTAASVAHAIANTAEGGRKELLALARKIPGSPIARARPDWPKDVISKKDASRGVSIADAIGTARIDTKKSAAKRTANMPARILQSSPK
jgi:xanthine dehydrogenase YagR molybdenum-binding subunit